MKFLKTIGSSILHVWIAVVIIAAILAGLFLLVIAGVLAFRQTPLLAVLVVVTELGLILGIGEYINETF